MPTWDQVKGIAERLLLIGLAWLVAGGYITQDQSLVYAPAILMAIGAIWAWRVNRPKAIVQSAAALPNTVVVTTPDLAKSTPEQNIVSTQGRTEEEITRELNNSQLR